MEIVFKRKKIVAFALLFVFLMAGLFAYFKVGYEINAEATGAIGVLPHTQVNTKKKTVYITVDTALGADYTKDILAVLDKKGVKATFAVLGVWMEKNEEIAAQITQKNHGIISHSMAHLHYDTADAAALLADAAEAKNKIEALTGRACPVIRPPYQTCSLSTAKILTEAGFIPVLFSIDAQDYTELDPATVASAVATKVKPGDIILFQNNNAISAPAIGQLIEHMEELGYDFGVLSPELFS